MMNDERERNGRVGSPGAVDGVCSSENAVDVFTSSFDIHHSLFDIRYFFHLAATESLRWNQASALKTVCCEFSKAQAALPGRFFAALGYGLSLLSLRPPVEKNRAGCANVDRRRAPRWR
jgi:hypothetical protein